MNKLTRQQMAMLVAQDLPQHALVNLGIGMPTMITDYMPASLGIHLHSENGIVGMRLLQAGEAPDPDLINASKQFIALNAGASICDHVYSFSMMRGGHIDITVLGAYEVAANGDLANWSRGADDPLPSVGGAMDLAVGARTVWVMMEALTREGEPRLLSQCTLPLTGSGVVDRVYTDIGIFDVKDGQFVVRALVEGFDVATLSQWVHGAIRVDSQPLILTHENFQ